MAEKKKKVFEDTYYGILEELFDGTEGALTKFSKVRHTYYEIAELWRGKSIPLIKITSQEKIYFSKRFLNGRALSKATSDEIDTAVSRLGFAVGFPKITGSAKATGCYERCCKLMYRLNEKARELGLQEVEEIDNFLNFFTYCGETVKNEQGITITEPGYGFEIIIFKDGEHRRKFRTVMNMAKKQGEVISVHEITKRFFLKKTGSTDPKQTKKSER